MNDDKCPRDMQIGAHEARIDSLEEEMAEVRKKVQDNAAQMIKEQANRSGFLRGVHLTATVIGYSVIIAAMLAGEKFMGAIESVLRFLSSMKV